jgi:Zn-dependent peptidase ImmA (M78 family)
VSRPVLALVDDSDLLADLRSLAPRRTMTWSEAHSIAERQAALLLDLSNITEPPVPQFVIASLPGIVVEYRPDWPTSGMSVKIRSHWRIVISANEPRRRQRFSVAHEFKHVLDDPVVDWMSRHLEIDQRHERAERLCNYFAACLLMPRPWIKHDWYGGLQDGAQLARRYYVSTEAMATRLSELGLTPISLALEKHQRHLGAAS